MRETLAEPLYERPQISDLASLKRYLVLTLGPLATECLVVFYLDANRRVITHCIVEGSNDSVGIDYGRLILKAISRGAHGLILAHNHPSGDASPSRADIRVTRKLADLAREFGIQLHDHLVVANKNTLSVMFEA